MKALVLSAGKGTRISGITKDAIPKVMLPVAGKPILEWHVEHLKRYGVREILINLHFRPEAIKLHFGDGSQFGVKIIYSYEPELAGTSGALRGFASRIDETLIVLYGDVMNEMDLKRFVEYHKSHKAAATLVVHETDHPQDSDIVELNDDMSIKALHPKPGTSEFGNVGNAACYAVEPVIMKYLPSGKSDFVKDVFPAMLSAGEQLWGYETSEFLKDMGTPERYLKIKEMYEKSRKKD